MTRVAILGTGRMGSAMARRLARNGHEVLLWNRDRERAEAVGAGRAFDSPSEAVREAEVAISIVTNADAVVSIYRGGSGTSGALDGASGKVFVNSSTSGPWILPDLERETRAAGASLVDAPVLGSPEAVEGGSATLLLGGEREAVDLAKPVMEAFGRVRVTGDLGTASRLKLLANSMLAIVMAAGGELLEAGTGAGLDREEVFAILGQYAPSLEARRPQFLEDRVEPALFTTRDLVKDLDMSLRQAHECDAALPLTGLTREFFGELRRHSPGVDIAAIRSVFDPSA